MGCDHKHENFACRFLLGVLYTRFFQNPLRNDVLFLFYRYELPGIHGLNFVLKNSLGGGGIASLRSDPQGKALGQMLLDFQIKNVPDLKSLIE